MHEPLLSVSGLRMTGHSFHLIARPCMENNYKWVCDLNYHAGLHYIQQWKSVHAQRYRNWTSQDESRQLSAMTWAIVCAGTKASNDYWKIEGTKAIRVHVRPRRAKFSPSIKTTYPGSDNETDTWYDRLGPTRTTFVRFKSNSDKVVELTDDWAHLMPRMRH